jgi:hypothetical protein
MENNNNNNENNDNINNNLNDNINDNTKNKMKKKIEYTEELYNQQINNYINNNIKNNMYLIELTKCCEYGSFITMYKDESLLDLYRRASLDFQSNEIKSLYIKNKDNNKILIPISTLTTIRDFIMSQIMDSNNPNMVPLYPLPCNVVYKIYIDDDHEQNYHIH